MKILFYINTINHGGAERVIVNLANAFSKEYHCVLVTSYKSDWEYSVNINVKRIILCKKTQKSFLRRNIELTGKLRKVIISEKPDVTISFMAEPNFRNIIATARLKIPTVISIRNDPEKEYPTVLFELAAKLLYPLATRIVFQTEDAKNWFPKSIRRKSHIIYNPIDNVFYENRYDGIRKNIVTTGRLVAQKNHKMLIRAFAEIVKYVPDNLIIYGDGELRNELETYVKKLDLSERVLLPGTTKDVTQAIRKAKLFVLSSDYEGMPNSLMEAMALGVPCISTDCPCGGPRMLLKGKCLIPVKDYKSLGEQMMNILLDKQQIIELSNYAISCAEQFKSERVYKEWNSVLGKII